MQSATKSAVVVGLIDDVSGFPAFRRGDEMWAQRAQFLAAFNVNVGDDCGTSASQNLLFVPILVPKAVATGAFYKANNLGAYTLNCTGGSPTTEDYILTPGEVQTIDDCWRG